MADQGYRDDAAVSRGQCVQLSQRVLAAIDQLAAIEATEKAARLHAAGAHIQQAIDILDGHQKA